VYTFVQIGINAVVGLLLQLVTALALSAAFLAERGRRAPGGAYLAFWNGAWLAQAVAIGALVVRFVFVPQLDIHHIRETGAGASLLQAVYVSAKMMFWAAVTAGCVCFQRPDVRPAAVRLLFLAGQVYAADLVLRWAKLDELSLGVYPAAIAAAVCCAGAMLDVGPGRRGPAAAATALALAAAPAERAGLAS
jgi:hypothetical protein